MSVSFGMLGILLMLDVCFIVNFFFIRTLRKWTDANGKKNKRNTLRDQERSPNSSPKSTSGGTVIVSSRGQDMAFAWCLGTVRLEPFRVQKFKGWKPLPGQTGLFTTCLFVIIGSVLLSSDLLIADVGVSSGSLDSDLCVFEDFDKGLEDLRSKLDDMTHLTKARLQHRLMVDFSSALLNDTALYGVPPYDCPKRGRVSGHKKDWDQPGPFFPGYCGAALEAALEVAKHRQCTQQICDCPTLPDSAVFKVTGLANKRYCGEVCIDVPYPCPQHSADMVEALDDYRFQQFEAAEQRRLQNQKQYRFPTSAPEIIRSTATETIDKIMHQVDIASYVYIGYSCLALFFPTPLNLFRAPYWVTLKQFFFGVQKPYFIISAVSLWWGVEYFRKLWNSPDIRLYLDNLRVGDPCFVNVEYLIGRQMILNEYCEALVPLEPEWNSSAWTAQDVLREVEHFAKDCNCPFPNENVAKWTQSIMETDLTGMGFTAQNMCASQDKPPGSPECRIMVPDQSEMVFLGNATICSNNTEARRLILEAPAPEHAGRDWYDLWISSGFLATLLVKIAVANFGLSLMTLADPFVVCAGEFLGMPMSLSSAEDQNDLWSAVLASKGRSLFVMGLSKTVFWGFLMHACLLNMFSAAYEDVGATTTSAELALEHRDQNVLAGCLGCAIGVALIGVLAMRKLHHSMRKWNDRKQNSSEVEATDEEELDGIHPVDESNNSSVGSGGGGHIDSAGSAIPAEGIEISPSDAVSVSQRIKDMSHVGVSFFK